MTSSPEFSGASGAPKKVATEIECADAARLTAAFVDGGLERKAVRLLRGHLDGCEECRSNYRTALEAAGRLGANLRESRNAPEGRESAKERNQRIVARASSVQERKRRPFALRALMLTAGMIFVAGWIGKEMDFPNPAVVYWESGDVGVADAVLGSETDGEELVAANWCWTAAGSSARILVAGTELHMGGETQVLLENRKDLSFRLRNGKLEIDGACEVLTSKGLVRIHDGEATIELRAQKLVVENRGGTVEFVSSLGTRVVEADQPPLVVE